MSFSLSLMMCLVILNASYINPSLVGSESVSNLTVSTEVNDLAIALMGAKSEEE